MKFGEFLIMEGLIDDEKFDAAQVEQQKKPYKKITEVLLEMNLIDHKKLTDAVARFLENTGKKEIL